MLICLVAYIPTLLCILFATVLGIIVTIMTQNLFYMTFNLVSQYCLNDF